MEILVFILPLFVVLVIVIAVYTHKKEKQRQQKLRGFAHSRNFYFHEARVHGFEREYPDFSFLHQGNSRYAYNIISGESNGNEVTGFDYHFQTTSTDSKGRTTTHHHHFSGFIIKSPFNLKPLTIRPEGLFDKMAGAFGWDDTDTELKRRHNLIPNNRVEMFPSSIIAALGSFPKWDYFEIQDLNVRLPPVVDL